MRDDPHGARIFTSWECELRTPMMRGDEYCSSATGVWASNSKVETKCITRGNPQPSRPPHAVILKTCCDQISIQVEERTPDISCLIQLPPTDIQIPATTTAQAKYELQTECPTAEVVPTPHDPALGRACGLPVSRVSCFKPMSKSAQTKAPRNYCNENDSKANDLCGVRLRCAPQSHEIFRTIFGGGREQSTCFG